MAKPWAVLLSDVHYSLPTLQLADAATRQAVAHANALRIPLIVAGDLHDTKGAMRGECVSAMLATFRTANVPVYIIPGNHCRINEKAKPHALEFLRSTCNVIDVPSSFHGLWLFPYESDSSTLKAQLERVTPSSTLIMHTGVQTAYMGHYAQDKSSLPKEAFAPFRVLSGHYHRRQDVGTVSYIGNPYTLNYGEATDPPKGYQILNTDGSLTFVPTNLRKHIVIDCQHNEVMNLDPDYTPGDLVKLRVSGPKSELNKLNRNEIGEALFGHSNFKLDLIPDKAEPSIVVQKAKPTAEILDALIDSSGETPEQQTHLKKLWRELCENT